MWRSTQDGLIREDDVPRFAAADEKVPLTATPVYLRPLRSLPIFPGEGIDPP